MRVLSAFAVGLLAVVAASCGGGEDGGGGSSGPNDTVAPSFDGASAAAPSTESRIELSWPDASDNVTPTSRIAYRIYAATEAGGQDFGSPIAVAPSGATSALLDGLDPASDYFFVVHAVDEAGNEDENTEEVSATTPDESAPLFAGVIAATATTSRTMLVEWKPGIDKGTPESELVYDVYLATEVGTHDFSSPDATSAPGQTSLTMDGLSPETDYFVVVRARDTTGNQDGNNFQLRVTMPEGERPSFSGAVQAIADGTTIKLYWAPATDNETEQANIMYQIHEATSAGGQSFAAPSYTTKPGEIRYTIDGLAPGTKYHYVVRARDVAGNTDLNVKEVNATTGFDTDNVNPNFAGVSAVTGTSPSTLLVEWAAATDDRTPASQLLYDVYVAESSGGQDFNNPSLTSPPGATAVTIAGLTAGAQRFVVVRARDAAGNAAPQTTELSGTTPSNPQPSDTTAPAFNGTPSAMNVEQFASKVTVSWSAAADSNYPAGDIRYHVCASITESDCQGSAFVSNIWASSDFGDTSITLNNLTPRTAYFIYVRAEDRSGNFETGNNSTSIVTNTSWLRNVLPIFQDKCNGCHQFDAISRVRRVPTSFVDPNYPGYPAGGTNGSGLFLADPMRPETSMIYRRINPKDLTTFPFTASQPNLYVGLREPRDGTGLSFEALSVEEDAIILEWIQQGAFGTD